MAVTFFAARVPEGQSMLAQAFMPGTSKPARSSPGAGGAEGAQWGPGPGG
jgi:hypothetical protein